MGSLPRVDEKGHPRLVSIDGSPPVLFQKPNYCPFAPRCKFVRERCWKENPVLEQIAPGHSIACFVDIKTGRER